MPHDSVQRGRSGHRLVVWVVAFLTAPFVLVASMLLLFGSDSGDRIAGIVMLVIFGPGPMALHRWAHPRRSTRRTAVACDP